MQKDRSSDSFIRPQLHNVISFLIPSLGTDSLLNLYLFVRRATSDITSVTILRYKNLKKRKVKNKPSSDLSQRLPSRNKTISDSFNRCFFMGLKLGHLN